MNTAIDPEITLIDIREKLLHLPPVSSKGVLWTGPWLSVTECCDKRKSRKANSAEVNVITGASINS